MRLCILKAPVFLILAFMLLFASDVYSQPLVSKDTAEAPVTFGIADEVTALETAPILPDFRMAARGLAARASASTDPTLRQAAVSALVGRIPDILQNVETHDLNTMLGVISKGLLKFSADDFSADATNVLLTTLLSSLDSDRTLVDLRHFLLPLGVARAERAKPLLAKVIEMDQQCQLSNPDCFSSQSWTLSATWNAMKASARIYQSSDVSTCIATVMERNTNSLPLPVHAGELTYIRQPEVVDFFANLLGDDFLAPLGQESEGCIPPPQPIAFQAAGYLCWMYPDLVEDIERYEVDTGTKLYGMERLNFVREWMASDANRDKLYR